MEESNADTSGSFSLLVALCKEIDKEDSYGGKTQLVSDFLKKFKYV